MEENCLHKGIALAENLCESKTEETVALNAGKKPEVPPKPIMPQSNHHCKERNFSKRSYNSGILGICTSAAEISKQLEKVTLELSSKHTSLYRKNEEKFPIDLVMYKGGKYTSPATKDVSKPPLLPKPSPQLYQNSLAQLPCVRNKRTQNTIDPVQTHKFTTLNKEVESNVSKNIYCVSKAANLVEAPINLNDRVIAEKGRTISLGNNGCYVGYKSDQHVKSLFSVNGKIDADCSSYSTTKSFLRYKLVNDTFCIGAGIHHLVSSSLPNLYFEGEKVLINYSNKALFKQYPYVNAVCDTFYPSNIHPLKKVKYHMPEIISAASCDTHEFIDDSIKGDLTSCDQGTSTHASNFLSHNVKSFETPFQNLGITGSKNNSKCNATSNFLSSVCSANRINLKCVSSLPATDLVSIETENLSFNLQSIDTKQFSRSYSLPICHNLHLQDKFQPESLNKISATDRKSQRCSKSTWFSENAGEQKSSESEGSKFPNFFEKGTFGKESRNSCSTFYFECDLLNKDRTSSANDVSASEYLSMPEEKLHSSRMLSRAVDTDRPESGISDVLELGENSDTPSSEACFSAQDISDSDNDDNVTSLHQSVLTDAERIEKKIFYTVRELLTSEKVFVDVLRLLTKDFKNAVQISEAVNQVCIIPQENFSKILNNLPQLLRLNEDLLNDFENRIENWHMLKKISDVIVKKGPFLKLYSTYIQNFEYQCNYLDECCCKYPKFASIVKKFEASPRCKKLSVKHYMIKPVQRIPQYRLILSDYLSMQTCDSPDYEDTKAAVMIVSDVADHANRKLKLGDGLKKLMQLQTMLGNYEIIKPGRDLIKDGELFKLSRKVMQPRYFILLNDCLLCTSYVGSTINSAESVKVNYHLSLDDLKVSVPNTQAYENEFSIISTQRSFCLSARSSEERDEWVTVLTDAIREYEKRKESFNRKPCSNLLSFEDAPSPVFNLGKDAPVWVHDFRVTRCQSCTELFTVTFRRHHCRACGKVVCGNCSENKAPLEYKKYHSARVCGDCFKCLLKEFEVSPPQLQRSELVTVRARFIKKGDSGKKKYVPERLLEVTANDTKSQMSGWLKKRTSRSWKRYWFVLKNQVLYVYKASEDVVALESIPVLGYKVVSLKQTLAPLYEGVDKNLVFQLHHVGQNPMTFQADTEQMACKWMAALEAQTVF